MKLLLSSLVLVLVIACSQTPAAPTETPRSSAEAYKEHYDNLIEKTGRLGVILQLLSDSIAMLFSDDEELQSLAGNLASELFGWIIFAPGEKQRRHFDAVEDFLKASIEIIEVIARILPESGERRSDLLEEREVAIAHILSAANRLDFEQREVFGDSISAATEFGSGTYFVGMEIEPGTYRASRFDECNWERLSSFTRSSNDIIASSDPGGAGVVTILPSDKGFKSRNCGTWTRVSN